MSEIAKTVTFIAVGLVAIGIGLLSVPSTAEISEDSLVGTNLRKALRRPMTPSICES